MLILCSGPDTYHARKKARELVAAFRQKHDPTGYSTEIMPVGAMHELPILFAKIGAPSLFASKRLIRCDGLLDSLKIAEVRQLAKRLESVREETIILSVEDQRPTEKILKEFESSKLVHYPFPLLSGARFMNVVTLRAKELGVSEKIAQEIARRTDGDMWLAEQELEKASANPQAPRVQGVDDPQTVFDAADAYLLGRSGWRERVSSFPDESMVSILTTQSRTFARVHDGETSGAHPYVVRKFSSMKLTDAQIRVKFLHALRSFYISRTFATDEEAQTML